MKCTEICTSDTLFIDNQLPGLKNLFELTVSICSSKYKYINSPTGVKLLIEGVKIYNICYSEDTKREQVVNKKFKIPFCSIIPINSSGCGYRSIEFIVEELKITEVNRHSVVTALLFKIICENKYNEANIEIINSQVMEVKTKGGTLRCSSERDIARKRRVAVDKEKKSAYSSSRGNLQYSGISNSSFITYLIYNDIQTIKILLFAIVACVYLNKNQFK